VPSIDRHRRSENPRRSLVAPQLLRALWCVLLWGLAQSALAVDSVFGILGGDRNIVVYGGGIGWGPWWSMPMESDRLLSLSGIVTVTGWDNRYKPINKSLVAFGVYPVMRFDAGQMAGVVPYIEAAIGFNVLTHTWIEERRLSTAFQFGEFVGVGFSFGDRREFDLAVRYQHISNADIKRPNDGLSYANIVFTYHFASP
jgi:hypothetical protein